MFVSQACYPLSHLLSPSQKTLSVCLLVHVVLYVAGTETQNLGDAGKLPIICCNPLIKSTWKSMFSSPLSNTLVLQTPLSLWRHAHHSGYLYLLYCMDSLSVFFFDLPTGSLLLFVVICCYRYVCIIHHVFPEICQLFVNILNEIFLYQNFVLWPNYIHHHFIFSWIQLLALYLRSFFFLLYGKTHTPGFLLIFV